MAFTIIGVYPIAALQPCALLEVDLGDSGRDYPWGEVTQAIETQPRPNWQAPYEEQQIGKSRWVFFFHYFDFDKPLLTPDGPISVPLYSPMPTHLRHIQYDEVD